jgi:osmoprotectant transport system permease protein
MKRRWTFLRCAFLLSGGLTLPVLAQDAVVVGSKSFTESVIVGELATLVLRASAVPVKHRRELGGTRILFGALEAGEIDVYGEYTGTLTEEILADESVHSTAEIRAALATRGIAMTEPLGFDNTYAIGVRAEVAEDLGLRTISDMAAHPDLRLGLTNEFLDRGDGWPGLRQRYGLPQGEVRGLDHDLAYKAIGANRLDAKDVYTTDAEIAAYDLVVLEDDRSYFPRYEAVLLYRQDLATRHASAVAALDSLAGRFDEERMQRLNGAVKLGGDTEQDVAAGFLAESLGIAVVTSAASLSSRLAKRTLEHLFLVSVSLIAAIAVAIPLGIFAAARPRWGQVVLGLVGIIQTIPALALLVFMIPLLGIYAPPALAALFLYSLLPIVRNTHAGLVGIAAPLSESAAALGLSTGARLRRVELPLALPSILAGIKTAAVINVGFATLGALVGAGGYGQAILTGIRLDSTPLILEGALPAAAMALATQGLFEVAERLLVPRGLRGG